MAELDVGHALIAGARRDFDRGQDLVGLERRRHHPLQELADCRDALAASTSDVDLRVQRDENGRQIRCGIRMRDVAADRAAVPDLRIADHAGGFTEDRACGSQRG